MGIVSNIIRINCMCRELEYALAFYSAIFYDGEKKKRG